MVVRPRLSARSQLAVPWLETVEYVMQHSGSAGLGQELRAEADQAARRHRVVDPGPTGAVIDHLDQATLAQREQLGDYAEELLGHVDRHRLHRLAHGQLETLPSQHLNENGELQLAASLHLPGIGSLRRQQSNRDVADKLGIEAALQQPDGDLGPFAAR